MDKTADIEMNIMEMVIIIIININGITIIMMMNIIMIVVHQACSISLQDSENKIKQDKNIHLVFFSKIEIQSVRVSSVRD